MPGLKINVPNARVVDVDTLDKVLDAGNGDAALVYLYLVKNGQVPDVATVSGCLDFEADRMDKALLVLRDAGITEDEGKLEYPPKITPSVLRESKNQSPDVRELCTFYEKRTGRLMKKNEFSAIHDAYVRLHLPAPVIMAMITYLSDGEKMLTAVRFEKEACSWADTGIDTLEKAEEYLLKVAAMGSQYRMTAKLLNLSDRPLSPTEEKYIKDWLDCGFTPETIQLAYDKTVVNMGSLKWPYLNKILSNWHEKGVHTKEQALKNAATSGGFKQNNVNNRYGAMAQNEQHSADTGYSQKVKEYLKNKCND